MIRSIFKNSTFKIHGCMTSYATNYNPLANVPTACIFPDNSGKIFIHDANEYLTETHGVYIRNQFLLFNNIPDRVVNVWGGAELQLAYAKDSGVIAFIYSYFADLVNVPQSLVDFYPNLYFTPVGSNNGIEIEGNLGIIVTCGAGTTQNETAWGDGLEFWDTESQGSNTQHSSFANGTVAAKLLTIKEARNCTFWEARYCARITADRNEPNRPANTIWHNLNGFGKINTQAAINYNGIIPRDPYIFGDNVYTPFA